MTSQAEHAPAPSSRVPDGSEPALTIRGLSKSFGAFQALRDVNLDIRKGEFVCFLGPSGCGKTTLLRAIAGLDPQDRGTIHQNGRDISDAPVAGRDFGIVFQSYALFPNLTVERNVGYGLRGAGMTRARRSARVAELLEMVGLTSQARKYPAQISGGQQQRVALARALAPSPQLLLLDEPLSALDAQVRLHLRGELRQLQRELGVTTVMVTHDQDEALSLADRLVVMNQGVIEQVGEPEDVFSNPVSSFVAGFLGDMNFLNGRTTGDGEVAVSQASFRIPASSHQAPDTRVKLGIRPSDITVSLPSAAMPGRMRAVIETVSFRGTSYLVATRCRALAQDLRVELAPNEWRALGLTRGSEICLEFPPGKLHLFGDGIEVPEAATGE